MPMPMDAKGVSVARRKVVLTLIAGPLLGTVIFFALAGHDESPFLSDAGHIHVPWHKSTQLTALEQTWNGPDTVDVLTRRDGKSGTSYVLRRIDCKARAFQFLGEGKTEQQAREGHAADPRKSQLTEGSISFYVAAHVCPDGKTR